MEINNASINSAATEYDSKVNLKETADPPLVPLHGAGRYILPVILLIDCSSSFEFNRHTINEAVYKLIERLNEGWNVYLGGIDIFLTLITFNHNSEVIYQGVYIGDLRSEQWKPLQRECYGVSRPGPALAQAIHIGKAQHDYLQEQMVNGYKPMYIVFSDFINTAGKGASPEQTKEWQEEFETVAKKVREDTEAKCHAFVSCVYLQNHFAEESLNNVGMLSDPKHTLVLNDRDPDTICRILIHFIGEHIHYSPSVTDVNPDQLIKYVQEAEEFNKNTL